VPAVPARVVDTTGAGDTFTGVLAATLAEGADLAQAVSRAVVAGALSVEQPGAVSSIPARADIDERARR
jgi:ribokinase